MEDETKKVMLTSKQKQEYKKTRTPKHTLIDEQIDGTNANINLHQKLQRKRTGQKKKGEK